MRKKNKTISKKRSLTFRLLYYWANLICINPLTLSDSNQLRFSYYCRVCGILLIVSYPYIWYRILIERLKILVPGETPIVTIATSIELGTEFVEAVQTWLIFSFHQNRVKLIVKSFIKAEKTSIKLDIRVDYEKCCRKLVIHLTVVTTTYLIYVTSYNASSMAHQYFTTFIWISYIFPKITSYNRWTMFIWILVIVKQKFQRINDKVRFLMQNDYAIMTGDNRVFSRLIRNSNCNPICLSDKIKLIARLHRELRDVVHRTVEHIAICTLMSILAQYLNITISAHIAYRFLKGCEHVSVTDVVYFTSVVIWFVISIGLLALISNVCGSTADEANETGNILHAMLNNIDNFGETREAAKFNVLSLDLLQNQLRLSVLGFFNLDYYLVYNAITTTTTLLTIMLQFYN